MVNRHAKDGRWNSRKIHNAARGGAAAHRIPNLGIHHLEVICRLSSIVLIDRFDYGIELQLERIPPAWHPDAKNSFRATQI